MFVSDKDFIFTENYKTMTFRLKEFPRVIRPFLKLTRDSKTPTDLELDELKHKLAFYFPPIWHLLKIIIKEELKRFVKYRWKKAIGWIFTVSLIVTLSYFTVKWFIEPVIVKMLPARKALANGRSLRHSMTGCR